MLTYMFHDLFIGSLVCLFLHILEHFENCILFVGDQWIIYLFIFIPIFKRGALVTIVGVTKPHMDDCTNLIQSCTYSYSGHQFHSFSMEI